MEKKCNRLSHFSQKATVLVSSAVNSDGRVSRCGNELGGQGSRPQNTRRIGGSYGLLEHFRTELGNSDTALPERGARMLARGTEGGGGIVAKYQPVMGWTRRRSARKATDLSRPLNRKAP